MIMEGKAIMGVMLVVIMGIVIFGIVSMINSTLDKLDERCEECGDECEIKACTSNSSSTGRIFSYVLIGIYLLSSAGILYFSFKKGEEQEPKIAAEPSRISDTEEYAYG